MLKFKKNSSNLKTMKFINMRPNSIAEGYHKSFRPVSVRYLIETGLAEEYGSGKVRLTEDGKECLKRYQAAEEDQSIDTAYGQDCE